jgi:hypothetical protein
MRICPDCGSGGKPFRTQVSTPNDGLMHVWMCEDCSVLLIPCELGGWHRHPLSNWYKQQMWKS